MRKQIFSALFVISALATSAALAQQTGTERVDPSKDMTNGTVRAPAGPTARPIAPTAGDRQQERTEASPSKDTTTSTVGAPARTGARPIAPTATDRLQERQEKDPSKDMTNGTVK